jgi:hypothetical protein
MAFENRLSGAASIMFESRLINKKPLPVCREGLELKLSQLELVDHVGRDHDFVPFGARCGTRQ